LREAVLAVVADFVFVIDPSPHCAGLPKFRLTTGTQLRSTPSLA
jgi:hypothetical protein